MRRSRKLKETRILRLALPLLAAALLIAPLAVCLLDPVSAAGSTGRASQALLSPVTITVDDFEPQPYQGETVYYYNRLDGDRGALNETLLDWGFGVVTATISPGRDWGGLWMSLNHPIVENLAVNFSQALPPAIQPAYQSAITRVSVELAGGSPNRNLKLELKNGSALVWVSPGTKLLGGRQTLSFALPALGDVSQLVIVLEQAQAGDYMVLDEITLEANTAITDTAQAAFVWSYAMLLNNWNPATGLIRDNGKFPSGAFEAVQATGALAAATAQAYQLGVVEQGAATSIVRTISDTLLAELPRYRGLLPHWVVESSGVYTIVANTEWSSVDTVIAALGLLEAQTALGLDASGSQALLQAIDWPGLTYPSGLSHGYRQDGAPITSTWDTFGGESWLVDLAYAAALDAVPPLQYPQPPTANGSGFIDELAWLFLPPPPAVDAWGVDWEAYRQAAAIAQASYYTQPSCFAQLGLFGLSAAETPLPSAVAQEQIYQPFGVGGRFSPANDGSALLGAPVAVPHYSAMIASLLPAQATSLWGWLIEDGPFSPLNNVESLLFATGAACSPEMAQWNQLKGSWNLALQTLGWGRYLAQRNGKMPILWQAVYTNPFLRAGYKQLAPEAIASLYLPLVGK